MLYFAASIIPFILAVIIQSHRTQYFWTGTRHHMVATYDSLIIGNFYNALLPGNLGEGVRALHQSRRNLLPFIQSFTVVLTEKWLDSIVFVVLVALLFAGKHPINNPVYKALLGVAAGALLLHVIYLTMRVYRPAEKAIWKIVLRIWWPGKLIFRLYAHVNLHLQHLRIHHKLSRYAYLSLVMLFLNCLQYYLLLFAAGVPLQLCTFYIAYLAAVSMMVVVFIPSAPGNIGVIHYGMYLVLIFAAQLYGVTPTADALRSFALFGTFLHFSCFIPEVVLGLLFVIKNRKFLF